MTRCQWRRDDHVAGKTQRNHPPRLSRHGTVATAATLTAPVAGDAQAADTVGATKMAQANTDVPAQLMARAKAGDWTKPAAMAIPKEGYFTLEQGRYGPLFPKTPANYGFTLIAKNQTGSRSSDPSVRKNNRERHSCQSVRLAPLRLHYLRWVLFNIGSEPYFIYQGIFDTDFDKYTEDAVALFTSLGVSTTFENSEVSRWIGRPTLRHSSDSSANINAQAFSNTVSIRSSVLTK